MAIISKGITLSYKNFDDGYVELYNLQEIPDLGGEAESLEITTLADAAHMYTDGLLNYGDSLAFKFLYDAEQFDTLQGLDKPTEWRVTLPDGVKCDFGGKSSVKLDGIGVNAVLTYTLSIKPMTAMVWGISTGLE